ncbi:MAG: 5-keto-4-deoxy-D-glucarate aldolase [Rhodospirillaceae bacterium]|jgi:4-hydroxy-2-oxoheptanedioate aldolase|nr:2,4-dihydroxyhept-2-ene-1,7-dioic acid aldolase [Alphaproteobacteria bacterium]MBL6777304.1 2,4-dihydroxyhept-2-ene-1,7-dioic acid aldolase [Alphaproteobacteria bacterium]CAI8326581.1 MAG: 5-keto-4-deoxy-D-glucarate aldolase [Rhodospirillaceae bacterium]
MKLTKLHDRWAAGKPALNGWCSIPSTVTAEIMSNHDYDSLTIDLQHGLVDYQTALTMLQAMNASGITPMARVPWNEPGIIMKLLDAGCLGIICPMINTAEDAAAFVGAMRYAPDGYRSSGPTRAIMVHGADYHHQANETLVSMAMIETVEAFGNVDAICATEGLTGLYVGPSDLAVSMGHNPGLDRQEEDVDAAIGKILETAKKHGLKAGIHCGSPDYLKSAYERGFDFATIASDIRLIGQAIAMNINAIR